MKAIHLVLSLLLLLLTFDGISNNSNFKIRNNMDFVKKDTLIEIPKVAVYPELLGKGFFSFNVDLPINFHHRYSVGITWLDYSFMDYENYSVGGSGAPTASFMYYYLLGTKHSFLELGAGISVYHRLDLDYNQDSPLSLHGVIGYRYQKKDGLIFRAGFTPFQRVNNWFLPLFGISLGYSW